MADVTIVTLSQLLEACALHRVDAPLIVDAAHSLTGRELGEAVNHAVARLKDAGVCRGHRVAFDTRGSGWVELAVGYSALSRSGAVPILVHTAETVTAARSDVGAVAVATCNGSLSLTIAPVDWDLVGPSDPTDVLDVVFTSGTTGVPRAVRSRHAEWLSSSRPEMLLSRGRRTVAHCGVPFAVSGGVHGILINHLVRGVTSVHARTPAELAPLAAQHHAAELHLTPFSARGVLRAVSANLGSEVMGWSEQVRVIRLVGSSVSDDVRVGLAERFPRARCVSIYALTEGGSACCVDLEGGAAGRLGQPSGSTQIQVRDAAGHAVGPGGSGEIVLRAASAPAYTDNALEREWHIDGWTRTGDMATVLDDGTIQLVGRAREQVNLGSGRLSPDTVEAILRRRTGTDLDFAVTGVHSAGRSDALAVFVEGERDDPSVLAFLEALELLQRPFHPRYVHVLPTLPRTGLGKVRRRDLLELIAGELGHVAT